MNVNFHPRIRRPAVAVLFLEALESRVLLTAAPVYTFAPVASFNSSTTGAHAQGLIMDSAGNFYGTTPQGGKKGYGTVFKIAAGTSTITTLASFMGGKTQGIAPRGNLVLDAAGNLYGVTVGGGAFAKGTIFEVAAGTSAITTLASFNGVNGAYPFAGLVMDGSGNLFGEAMGTGTTKYASTVFELATGSGTITAVATFKSTDQLNGVLVINSAGDIFGTTSRGGSAGRGSIFKIAAGSQTATTLASFKGTNSGLGPTGTLLLTADGSLIGTTTYGGTNGDGTIFKLFATASTVTTLVNFNGTKGNRPVGTLIMDSGGNLFGVTAVGGSQNVGTVYELPAGAGTVTSLYSFRNGTTGGYPTGALVLGPDGVLWGTTFLGGTNNSGKLFSLTPPTSDAVPPKPV